MSLYKDTNPTSVKGRIGEEICVERWMQSGLLVYGLLNGLCCPHCHRSMYGHSRRHFFDYMVMRSMPESFSPPVGKPDPIPLESIRFIEVKTKQSLNGRISINRRDLDVYEQFTDVLLLSEKGGLRQLPFTVVFVDDKSGGVYSQSLEKLFTPIQVNNEIFPREVAYKENIGRGISNNPYVWFSLSQLTKHFTLSREQIQVLNGHTTVASSGNDANVSAGS